MLVTTPEDASLTIHGGGTGSYHANWHTFGGGWNDDWQTGGTRRLGGSFPDGTSNTMGFFERYARCGNGTAPDDWNSNIYASLPMFCPIF